MKEHHINQLSMVIVVLGLLFVGACNYYKPIPTSPSLSSKAKSSEIASMSQKTFIIRSNRGDFLLKNAVVQLETENLTGILEKVPEEHQVYIKNDNAKYDYKASDPSVLQEIHVYVPLDSTAKIGNTVFIPVSSISKMELIQRDKKKSSTNTIILVSGVTLGALAVAAVISAIAVGEAMEDVTTPPPGESSCPFVSVYDGKEFVFQGETFGGALFHSVARQDYLPLPSLSIGSDLKLLISNERLENQYIDMADLLLVEHAPGEKVLVDPQGPLFLVEEMKKPKGAILNNQKEMLDRITESDNVYCSFNDLLSNSSENVLTVKFDHPGYGKDLALYLNLRDSPWLEYVFEQYISMYGEDFKEFEKSMDAKSAEELYQWQDMNLVPLTISVKTGEGWKEVRKTRFVGPVTNREIAISLEGFELKEPTVEVSFKTGFLYWELDQIALASVTKLSPESIRVLKPSIAEDENGKNQLDLISELDEKFLEQPETGNKTYLTYQFREFSKSKAYSAFLHTGGYYKIYRDFTGPRNDKFLSTYEKPGGLADFSRKRFAEVSQLASSSAK